MRPRYESGTGSIAAIAGHPLHPVLVPLPIGFTVAAFLADLGYFGTNDPFWALAAYWLLLGAAASGFAAAIPGIIDFMSIKRARTMGVGWVHAIGNVVALGALLANFRFRMEDPANPALPYALLFTGVIVAIFAVTGWMGGELTFRHGVGVSRAVGRAEGLGDEDHTPSGKDDIGKS